MYQNPIFRKKKKVSVKKKKKNTQCDSLFNNGYVVSRRPNLSPPHQKFFARLKAKQNQQVVPKSDFHMIQNRFNTYQDQLSDKSRVEELNKGLGAQERGNFQNGIQMGQWVRADESPKYNVQTFEENISKEVTTLSNRRQKTPPKDSQYTSFRSPSKTPNRMFSSFKCSPKPHIFSKYKKTIPSIGEETKNNNVEFTPRILSQMKFVKRDEEEAGNDIDDLMTM